MELDKRIKEGKRPLTCLDIEQAREFEGKLCLFSPLLGNYKNISEYSEYPQYTGILTIRDKFDSPMSEECPYRNGNDGYFYELVLPLEWIKEPEKKYRPFTLAEWIGQHTIGDVIHYRSKSGEIELRQMYVGTRHSQGIKKIIVKITLGNESHTLDYLLKDYEIEVNGEWLPFGVLDE